MNGNFLARNCLLASTALTLAFGLPAQALAQAVPEGAGLEEIVVTAQKREQSLQDVPIAVTAVTQENLQANRIFTVNDLSAIAPGVTVKPSAGGISTPAFTMRGQVSFGVVAGSDKQVSIYVDGVYISSPRGSIFDLPDIQRLEVLRGPQGTLFGRNATAGAISVTTRDPTGEQHIKLEGGFGNFNSARIRATLDTAQIGPFSAYFSYIRNYRRGDIENAGAGTVWDRSLSPSPFGIEKSPRWLGTVDSNSYFAAVKFEPSDSFKIVYKYDRNDDHGTPEGTSFIAYDKSLGGGLAGAVLTALYSSNNTYINPSGLRPDIVANAWVTRRHQQVQGHSATATWQASDNITVKDIFAYRRADVFAPSSIDGVSSLTYTQAVANASAVLTAASVMGAAFFALSPAQQAAVLQQNFIPIYQGNVGKRIDIVASAASSIAKQWSNELQVNYSSDKLQATVGALWFHSKDEAGGPIGIQNTLAFDFTPNCVCIIPASGQLPLRNEGRYFNKATSVAAYAQLEYKILPELELVAGGRITHDQKTSRFRWDINGTPQPLIVPPKYSKTKPNWLIGLNWKPNRNTLVYAKYSTSFVSGGSVAGITYEPETASSIEAGIKADLFDHRLRTNLSVYRVIYNHFQGAGSTSTPSSLASILPILTSLYGASSAAGLAKSLSTFVNDQGKLRAEGVELEVTAAPTRGLTLGGSVSYTGDKFLFIQPLLLAANGGHYDLRDRPKWTASGYATYETQPLWDDTTLQLRADGLWHSSSLFTVNALNEIYADRSNATVAKVGGVFLLNARVALRHMKIGPTEAEFALWGKNLTNNRDPNFVLITPLATSANYGPSRTYGVELAVDF